MGKKRVSILGSESEDQQKAKSAVKREQKKLREGKEIKKTKETATETPAVVVEEEKKSTKKIHIRSKTYQAAKSKVDVEKYYPLSDALKLLREVSLAKFDPTVELHLTLTNPANKTVDLPYSTGKIRRVAIATDDTIKKIEAGKIDFDILLASPDQMPKLIKFAKTLGPRGLMPNPKTSTVVPNPESTLKSLNSRNTLTLRTEKDAPLIHTIVGKLSMSDTQLSTNIQAILSALSPDISKAILKSTISPAIKLQV